MKKAIFFVSFLSLFFGSCAGTKYKVTYKSTTAETKKHNTTQKSTSKSTKNSDLATKIVRTANSNLGVKYKYGGTTKSGFDCSGLVFTSFKAHKITLPRSSSEMAKKGKSINTSEAQKGDLIFFSTGGGKKINHVGIITEVKKNEIKFIHSSTQLGVIISSTKEAYYKKNYIKIMRVL